LTGPISSLGANPRKANYKLDHTRHTAAMIRAQEITDSTPIIKIELPSPRLMLVPAATGGHVPFPLVSRASGAALVSWLFRSAQGQP